jgi:hypothetical protein
MNINSDVLWDPTANKSLKAAASNIARSISSNSNRSTGTSPAGSSYGDRRRRGHTASVVATNLLHRWEGGDEVNLSPTSFAKNQRSFHDRYSDSNGNSRKPINEASLAEQYESSKEFYRSNITQAKVAAQLAQNRLNYQTGLTGQAMVESMIASSAKVLDDGYPNDWVEGWDDIRQRKYYYSKSRKKSVWRLPEGASATTGSRQSSRASSPVISSSAKAGNGASYRTASPRKMTEFSNPLVRGASPATNSMSNGPNNATSDTSWVEAYDQKLQRQYWYHK